MNCKVCNSNLTNLLWTDKSGEMYSRQWYRCQLCGSDSADRTYYDTKWSYTEQNVKGALENGHGMAGLIDLCRANADWFVDYAHTLPNKYFLDIGSNEGAMLESMKTRGFTPYGFDVNPDIKDSIVTIADEFDASLFNLRFGAVNCREVIEHVDNWKKLISDAYIVMEPGGIFQIQTPRPWPENEPLVYQFQHLVLFSPIALRIELLNAGFLIIESRYWPMGQVHLCRKPINIS